jgi:AraC family transcriptional regulator
MTPDGLADYWSPRRFRRKDVSIEIKGVSESWPAPVAKIAAPSGFGEEVWQSSNPVTMLGVRLNGERVRHRDGRRAPHALGADVALMAKGTPNEYVADGPIVFAQINLSDAFIDRAAEFAGAPKLSNGGLRSDAAFCESQPLISAALAYAQRALIARAPPTRLEMEGRALLLLDALLEWHELGRPRETYRGGLSGSQLRRVVAFMTEHVADNLALDELASLVNLSAKHFARAFRQSTGVPPHRWLIERRIDRAKNLLATADLGLAEIALACGFADQSHFTAAFRRGTGVTPGTYRQETRI